MPAPKCPYQTTIIVEDFACHLALPVTVRNTPQIHCQSEDGLQLCNRVYTHLKTVGLAAFEMDDDLATTPHNIYLKIQYGGLLGLQAMLGTEDENPGKIADVGKLVETITQDGKSVDNLDYASLTPRMLEHKTRRRRK